MYFQECNTTLAVVIYATDAIEERRSVNRIPVSELVFENLLLTPLGSNFVLSGRVKNNSEKFTLTDVSISLTFKDCQVVSMSPQELTVTKSPNTSADYAAWLVKNTDKRGTPDYETVAKAYEHAKFSENTSNFQPQTTTKYIDGNCITIGENENSLMLTLPPGQARDFENFIGMRGDMIKPKGKFEWSYRASKTRGK